MNIKGPCLARIVAPGSKRHQAYVQVLYWLPENAWYAAPDGKKYFNDGAGCWEVEWLGSASICYRGRKERFVRCADKYLRPLPGDETPQSTDTPREVEKA